MPDLVGVVIPAYIGALSSLAGVVVAIVALVTARRARADARTATDESTRVAAREVATRAAVVELAGIAKEVATAPAVAVTASSVAAAAVPEAPTGIDRRAAGGQRSRRRGARSRTGSDQDAVPRRPSWARPQPTRTVERSRVGTAPADSTGATPHPTGPSVASGGLAGAPIGGGTPEATPAAGRPETAFTRRLDDLVRRLSDTD